MTDVALLPPCWPEYTVPLHASMAWTPIDRSAPIAYVKLKRLKLRRGYLNQWEVVRCPYCGDRHEHSAGDWGEEPRQYLGGRVAHCHPESGSGEYRLVEWDGQELPPRPKKVQIIVERPMLPRELRAAVWSKTKGRCWYCGDETNPFGDFRVDHVRPVAAGGTDELANLVPCCHVCNAKKHALPVKVFRERCVYAQFNDGRFWFEVEGLKS